MPDFELPPVPDVPESQRGTGAGEFRYEDIDQSGRLRVTALPPGIGWAIWRPLLTQGDGVRALTRSGVIPILTRMVLVGTDATVRLDFPAQGNGRYQLAHREHNGTVDRLYLNMWLEMMGRAGRLLPREGPGGSVVGGRMFAEHVFTRLMAPPTQRKITSFAGLGLSGGPNVPPELYDGPPAENCAALPVGATWVDDAPIPDPSITCFGLDHTDSNQHVNSLTYPRLFIEGGLRLLADHGLPTMVSARSLEISFRKPCFAGERVRLFLRRFDWHGEVGVAGTLVDFAASPESPQSARCFARVVFRR